MPLGIITKNTPERLTFDLYEGCTGLKLGTLDQPVVPDTHTEKVASAPSLGSLPLGIIEEKTVSHLSYVWILQTVFLANSAPFFLAIGGKKPKVLCPKTEKSGHVRLYTVLDSLARVEVLEELHFYRSQECEYFICRLGSQDEQNDEGTLVYLIRC